MTDQIKKNYSLIQDKQGFRDKVAKRFGVSPTTVETSWFSKGYFPKLHEKKLLTMAKAEVKEQKQPA